MKKAIDGEYVYNLVIIFLLIMFGFLMASYSYSKAYRVSKSVVGIIENHSGYAGTNSITQKAIDTYLQGIGYNMDAIKIKDCPQKNGKSADWAVSGICIYKANVTKDKDGKTDLYITYGVVSYMRIDLPLIELIKVPVYGETERIYVFK